MSGGVREGSSSTLDRSSAEAMSRPSLLPEPLVAPLLLVLLATLFLFGIGDGSLRDWDEAVYAQVALEYVQHGDWLYPTWNGELWFHKPPLVMWLTALGYLIVGVGEWAPRITSALCGFGGVVALYLFVRHLYDARVALIAALVLSSTPHYLRFAKMGMLDVPLTFFVSISLYSYWIGLERSRWLVLSGAALGLAFMTKGVAAGIIPLAIGIDLLVHRRWQLFREPALWLGLAVAASIVVPWHVYQHLQHGQRFWDEYLFYHVVARSLHALEGHSGGPSYYLLAIIERQRPWFLLTFAALPYALKQRIVDRDEHLGFFLAWITAVTLIVALVQTKLRWYIIPVYPALSACIAIMLCRLVPRRHDRFLIGTCVIVLVGHLFFTSGLLRLDHNPELKVLGSQIQARVDSAGTLHVYGVAMPAALFYGQRHVVGIPDLEAAIAAFRSLDPQQPVDLLTTESLLSELRDQRLGIEFELGPRSGDLALIRLVR